MTPFCQDSFLPGPGTVSKFKRELEKNFPQIDFKILRFVANLMTYIRIRTINRLAKSPTQSLRGRKNQEKMASD